MKAAQELYEGVDVAGMGTVGLITYMRTDSLRISDEARAAGNDYIRSTYGDKYLPAKPRFYKSKGNVQDGHEAIRPSMPGVTPESVKGSLTTDQFKIYKLVWERFIASLMESCVQETMKIEIDANGYTFNATGYTVKFDGFTALYEEKPTIPQRLPVKLLSRRLHRAMCSSSNQFWAINTLHNRLQDTPKRRSQKRLKKTVSADRQHMLQSLRQFLQKNMLSARVSSSFRRNSARL